jgi:hypothetical protein
VKGFTELSHKYLMEEPPFSEPFRAYKSARDGTAKMQRHGLGSQGERESV